MASKTITEYSDDLDGSTEGVETVKFGLYGTSYEIDLSAGNRARLEEALEPFRSVARRAGGTPPTGRRGSSGRSSGGPDAKAVRAWAAENGINVPPRGRIPSAVIEQYQAANS